MKYTKRILILAVTLLFFPAICQANTTKTKDIDLRIIAKIESSNNPLAYNKSSQACGMYQITPICLKEYNILNPDKKMTRQALFDPKKAIIIADWYINIRIPALLKHYHLPDTVENRLRAYNSGIGTVIKGKYPLETRNYVKKYNKGGK